MTDTPIKTLLVNSISDCIKTVDGIKSCHIDPERGLAGLAENNSPPFVYIMNQSEASRKESEYRSADYTFDLCLFVKADSYKGAREQAIYLSALINKKILARNSTARQYCQQLEEETGNAFDIAYFEDNQCLCITHYHVKYKTAYGDQFTQNPQ